MAYFSNSKISLYFEEAAVVILDLNGLIVDDEPMQLAATNSSLAPYDVHLDENYWIHNCVGHKPMEYLPDLLDPFHLNDGDIRHIVEIKDKVYENLVLASGTVLIRKGVSDLIDYTIMSETKNLALATSTTRTGVNIILGERGLSIIDKFDFIVCGDDVSHAKPHPEIYNVIANYFGTAKSFVVFEDARSGVISAKSAGMPCLAVPNKFTRFSDLSCANLTISDMSSNAEIILQS